MGAAGLALRQYCSLGKYRNQDITSLSQVIFGKLG